MKIDDYRFGRITIDGRVYTSDVLIWPEGIDASWWRRQGHNLCPEDLTKVLGTSPDVLIIGQGASGMMHVPQQTRAFLSERCREVYVGNTREACAKFNELSGGPARVAAALHLTC